VVVEWLRDPKPVVALDSDDAWASLLTARHDEPSARQSMGALR